MRDLFFLSILPMLVFAILRHPFIGLGLWVWTAMFYPNGWMYGMAASIRYNLVFAGLTIFVFLISKEQKRLTLGVVGWLVILFFVWTTLSTALGLALPEVAWEYWRRMAKIVALFVFVLLVMNKKLHIDFFLWCLVLSVGFYAVVEGLKYIVSGGGHILEGMAGHILGDRNELAVAFAMLLPICIYLLGEYGKKSWILKFGFLGLIALLITSIIGTGSRGGMIALSAVSSYLFIKSKRKLLFTMLIAFVGIVVVSVVPGQWFDRMDTIASANEDGSFLGRLVAWKLSFILAMQNPFFGGGFKALDSFPVWVSLSQNFYQYSFIYTGAALPDPNRAHAAHSIYFQVLGDHGFVGLFLFVMILALSFLKAGAIAKKTRSVGGPNWLINLATMLRLSIFAYAIGGAALSFAYFDLIFAICAIIIVLEYRILAEFIKEKNRSGCVTN